MALTNGIKTKLGAIADAIRSKTSKVENLTLEQMASAIGELKVGELDYKGVVGQERANELNEYYTNAIARAKQFTDTWDKNTKTLQIRYNNDVVFLNIDTSNVTYAYYGLRDNYFLEEAELDLINCTNIQGLCYNCFSLKKAKIRNANNITNLYHSFYHCYDLEELPNIDYSKVKNFTMAFQYCRKIKGDVIIDTSSATNISNIAGYWSCADSLTLTNIENVTSAESSFSGNIIPIIRFGKWKQASINLNGSKNLSPESIKYIIWHALNGENVLGFENEGATSRTLTLYSTPYNSWDTWKLTKPSVEDCEFLGIDETEITKYGELTWEDIALNIKLITVGK